MAENSFKEWWKDLQDNKKSRKLIEKIKFNKNNFLTDLNSKEILILSDVNGLGDAIMLRGVIKPFIDDGYIITLVTKEYHKDAYNGLGIGTILLWKEIEKVEKQKFLMIIAHHLNARSYETLLEIKAYKKYIINTCEKLSGVITINSKVKPKNIWEVYDNFLNHFNYRYNLINFQRKEFQKNIIKDEYIAIHIGSGSLCTNWGTDNFINLSKKLFENNVKHFFVCGPFEKEILKKYNLPNLIFDLNFFELIEVVRNAKLIICNNTSILHLSVTVGTATISINRGVDYIFWHPYRKLSNYRYLHYAFTTKKEDYCSKYKVLLDFSLGLNKKGCPMLKNEISVDDVMQQIELFLND